MLRSAVILALIVSGLSLHADALDHWKYGEISGTGEDVAFGNGKFVAVGVSDSGSFIALSTNGTTWTQQPIPGLRSYPTVCFGDGKFIALTSYGAIAASTNGTHWESSILPDFGLAMTTSPMRKGDL